MSDESRILAGILLLSLVTVETGGLYMVRLWKEQPRASRRSRSAFARAGPRPRRRAADPRAALPAVRRPDRSRRRVGLAGPLAACRSRRC